MSQTDLKQLILDNTRLDAPRLLPEVMLYMAVDDLPLWRMGEEELKEHGLGTPFWAFAWAGGQALSRFILENPETVRGKRVLDFGAGSGMVGIAAMKAGAKEVVATDIDPVAELVMGMNAAANEVELTISTEDVVGRDGSDWDILLVGDVCYDKETADAVLPWIRQLAANGKDVLIGDPGRFYLPKMGLRRIAKYHAPTTSLMEDSDLRNAQVWTIYAESLGGAGCQA